MSNKDIAPITQGAVEANGGVIEVVSDSSYGCRIQRNLMIP